jgi:ATP/ADP translocase
MALGMALHFGGYEFIRNSCLALFTSQAWGFASPAAFPFANGLISPFSVILLWLYSNQLDKHGPRTALLKTNLASILIIGLAAVSLKLGVVYNLPRLFFQTVIGFTFLYQNSFQYLIYTQQWSFVASVLTPQEGSKYFATLAGLCSLVCSITGGVCLPFLLSRVGLIGLLATTCTTLSLCTICCEKAYALAQQHGFDPADKQDKKKKKDTDKSADSSNRFSQAVALFQRVPTLRALLCEVVSFQSLNTLLHIAFVRALQTALPKDDLARSAYSARLFSWINMTAAALQFIVFPLFLNKTEPRTIWRGMPMLPLTICLYLVLVQPSPSSLLKWTAAAFGCAKLMDYSIRSVVYPMAYQPLDFESRYVGKEIIGVFGSRLGKSGMSIL